VIEPLHAVYTLHVTLKISTERSDPPGSPEPRSLADDVLDELTSWHPRDREGMFRTWHRGALSLIHLNVLSVIEAEGPLSMSQLATALDVSDASATGIVDRMERRGLVERQHATDDRRQVRVHATDAGRSVFTGLHELRRAHLSRVLTELSDAELSAFLTGIRAIRAARARIWAAEGAAETQPAAEPKPGAHGAGHPPTAPTTREPTGR
jgi:DNA-binding MarR family transcriptional regulator